MKLSMRNIYKSFGSNSVLTDVELLLSGGEICALIGENGAGKSTLMNILGGVFPADRGAIIIDGKPMSFRSPSDSLAAGIAFIHQELNLINDLTVYENVFLGNELKNSSGLIDSTAMVNKTREIFKRMDVDIDPAAMVGSLEASYKQIVEIARALLMNASILIMDEPTTSLTEPEIERVFEMMRRLKDNDVSIIFISHKLKEILQICDRYIVLRDGRMVASGDIEGVSAVYLSTLIVGHEVNVEVMTHVSKSEREILRLENLSNGLTFRNVSLSLREGEVLGVTGLLGDGRSELFRAVFGEGGAYTGRICLDGKPIKPKSASQSIDMGIAYLPPNRKENGILKDMNILENASVTIWRRLSSHGVLAFKQINDEFSIRESALKIKLGQRYDLITSLSGGNQQKVMLAKWLSVRPKVLILDNPTQGVDVGAKEEIYEIISHLASEGMSIVVLSGEMQEIMRICSRTIVMYHGVIQGELNGSNVTEHEMMRLATGGIKR